MKSRQNHGPAIAAAKAGFSTATAYRIESDPRLPSSASMHDLSLRPLPSEARHERRPLDPPPDLELRGRPRPVRRLNKRALLIGAGFVVLVIAGAIIIALNPPPLAAPEKTPELYNTERKPTAEGLAKLPKSYAEIPQLGPPLPGDIGRALVENEKRAPLAPPASDAPFRPNPEEEAERAERIRQARIEQQARESGLFFRLSDKQSRRKQSEPDAR